MNRLDEDMKKVIKGQRYTLMKNLEDLSHREKDRLREMRCTFSELSDVHGMKERAQ